MKFQNKIDVQKVKQEVEIPTLGLIHHVPSLALVNSPQKL
jgi:hypothetical protein